MPFEILNGEVHEKVPHLKPTQRWEDGVNLGRTLKWPSRFMKGGNFRVLLVNNFFEHRCKILRVNVRRRIFRLKTNEVTETRE
jgi:hypothetical protein